MHNVKLHEPRICLFCRYRYTEGGLEKYCSTGCQIKETNRRSLAARYELPAKWEEFWKRVEDPDYYDGLRRTTPQSTLSGQRRKYQ